MSAISRASKEAVEKNIPYFDNRIAEINNTLLILKTNDKGHVKQRELRVKAKAHLLKANA